MKLVRTLPIVFSLVSLSTTAWAAQHDGHKPHHPAGSTAAGKVTPGSPEMARMDPVAVLQMTSNSEVAEVAHEVRQRLERVRSALLGATAVATASATPTARVASNKSR